MKTVRAATYSRVSTSHHGQNPEIQTHEMRRYCEARGWSIAAELIDHGYTGATTSRPGLQELQRLVKCREVDVVVVVKLDRLFRSLRHLVVTLEEWDALGIQFVAIKDAVDWSTPAGRFFVQVLGSLAELEKAILRERTMMGLDHARRLGKRLGRPRTCDSAAIQRLRVQGLSFREFQRRLGVGRGSISRALQPVPKTPTSPYQLL